MDEGQPINQQPVINQQQPIIVTPIDLNVNEKIVLLPSEGRNVNDENVIIVQPVHPAPPPYPERGIPPRPPRPIHENQRFDGYDDPSCLYVLACLAIFIPLLGLIGMCCFGCGVNLGPRQKRAFNLLVLCTLIGLIFNFIFGYYGYRTP